MFTWATSLPAQQGWYIITQCTRKPQLNPTHPALACLQTVYRLVALSYTQSGGTWGYRVIDIHTGLMETLKVRTLIMNYKFVSTD